MTQKFEYGVENPDFPDDPIISTGEDRERAIKLAAYLTKTSGRMIVAMKRTITYSEWEPFNTGIVPPLPPIVERQWEEGDTRV
jgi:hypothetical protein